MSEPTGITQAESSNGSAIATDFLRGKRLRSGLFVGMLIALLISGAGTVALLLRLPDPVDQVVQPEQPTTIAIRHSDGDLELPTTVRVATTPLPDMLSTQSSGLLTQVLLRRGLRVTNGTPLFRTNGLLTVGANTNAPFYRPLAVGDTGQDVRDLNRLLGKLGLLAGKSSTSSVVSQSTALACARLGRMEGRAVPKTLAKGTAVFDPSWVVWISKSQVTVRDVSIATGQTAPTLGSPVASLSPDVVSAAVIDQSENVSSLGTATITLTGSDLVFRVDRGALVLTPEAKAALAGLVAANEKQEGDGSAVSLDGVARVQVRDHVVEVPIPALVTDANGTVCVFGGSDLLPRAVRVLGSRPDTGTALVSGLSGLDVVVINPQTSIPRAHCG